MTDMRLRNRRRNVLINPRFQGGIALGFAAIVVVGGALFAWTLYSDARQALWEASMQAHIRAVSPYEIVGASLLRHLLWLFAAVFVVSVAAFLFVIASIRRGIGAIVASLAASASGDLSTPTRAAGMDEIVVYARRVDEMRGYVLERLSEIRSEAAALRACGAPPEEFARRWRELKGKIGGIAP